jgi:hypothetical protein
MAESNPIRQGRRLSVKLAPRAPGRPHSRRLRRDQRARPRGAAGYETFTFALLGLEVKDDRAVAELRASFVVGGHEVDAPAWRSARFRAGRILRWARWETEAEARADAALQRAG